MNSAELAERFAYHPPSSADIVAAHEQIRTHVHELAKWINALLIEGDAKTKSLDALDLAAMHANASVARYQQVNPEALDGRD
jgi:hypothetical protein